NAAEGGTKVGESLISGELSDVRTTLRVDVSSLSKVGGKKALYFVFDSAKKGHSICDVEDFLFTAK
ncbi:MAG: hypothetical protein IIZ65_04465, partial [Clostridia bacterium]|nr:hypothetical protein [Clostridia bacterium]